MCEGCGKLKVMGNALGSSAQNLINPSYFLINHLHSLMIHRPDGWLSDYTGK